MDVHICQVTSDYIIKSAHFLFYNYTLIFKTWTHLFCEMKEMVRPRDDSTVLSVLKFLIDSQKSVLKKKTCSQNLNASVYTVHMFKADFL